MLAEVKPDITVVATPNVFHLVGLILGWVNAYSLANSGISPLKSYRSKVCVELAGVIDQARGYITGRLNVGFQITHIGASRAPA